MDLEQLTHEELVESLSAAQAYIEELRILDAARKQSADALQRRNIQLHTAIEVSRAAASILDIDELMRESVELIREAFDLYYVGLFLVDFNRGMAVLCAGTGEAGQEMLARNHKLEVGGASMIGQCVSHSEARIALDVGEEAVRFNNPVLPNTRSELALPLRSRGKVIGALSVQSVEPEAFDETSIAINQSMADQLAVAIDNARLYSSLQHELTERERLQQAVIEAQQHALQELSTPIIPVINAPDGRGGVIVMPLIGSIDTLRAKDIMRNLLAGIREHQAKVVILDITGVPIVDSGVANHLHKTIQAARLKGARTIITGISDAVAETVVDLGIDWSGIITLRDLQTGLMAALHSLGYTLTLGSGQRRNGYGG
ncbi:MAG: GAF domain-containing protein [Anaerolineae bacterium]|nr:GAF domain-containing protein [Anaerolineae bacterium]